MASLIAKLWARVSAKRAPLSIMIVGLDNSGKTSILNHLSKLSTGHGRSTSQHSSATKAACCNHRQQQQHSAPASGRAAAQNPKGESNLPPKNDRQCSTGHNNALQVAGISSCHCNCSSEGNVNPTVGYNYERLQYKGLTITVLDFSGQNRYRNLWQEFYNGVDGIVFVVDSSDLIRFVVVRDELETMLSHPYFATLTGNLELPIGEKSSNTVSQSLKGGSEFLEQKQLNNQAVAAQKQITISQGKLIQAPLESSSLSTTLLSTTAKANCSGFNSRKGVTSAMDNGRRTKVPILFLANKTDLANSVDIKSVAKALNLNELPANRHPWFVQATSVKLSQGIVEGFDWLVTQLSVD